MELDSQYKEKHASGAQIMANIMYTVCDNIIFTMAISIWKITYNVKLTLTAVLCSYIRPG